VEFSELRRCSGNRWKLLEDSTTRHRKGAIG